MHSSTTAPSSAKTLSAYLFCRRPTPVHVQKPTFLEATLLMGTLHLKKPGRWRSWMAVRILALVVRVLFGYGEPRRGGPHKDIPVSLT